MVRQLCSRTLKGVKKLCYCLVGRQPTQENDNMAQMEQWNVFKSDVEGFLNGGSVSKVDASTVTSLLAKGDSNTKQQTKVTSAIKLMLEDYADSPVNGRAPALTGDAASTFTTAAQAIEAASAAFDSDPAIRGLLLPHGRSKESLFADGSAWVAFLVTQMRRNAISAAKGGWDGSADSIVGFHTEAN